MAPKSKDAPAHVVDVPAAEREPKKKAPENPKKPDTFDDLHTQADYEVTLGRLARITGGEHEGEVGVPETDVEGTEYVVFRPRRASQTTYKVKYGDLRPVDPLLPWS